MVTRKRRVRVHLLDRTTTIEGIQIARTRSDLVLDAAQLLGTENATDLSGRTAIPRKQVLFRQVLD